MAEGGSDRAERDRATSQSLERGLAILSSFTSTRQLIGTSELARELGLSRSTSHRYIATLAGLGYLQQDPETRRYRLGPRVLDLGFSALNSMDVREISRPYLQALSDDTGFTVNLAILDGVDIVYVERCRTARPGQREIDLDLHVGSRLPAYCTALGKAMLAFLPQEERETLVSGMNLARRGPNTVVDRDALLADLERIRSTRIAVNDEELAYGLRSIAAPILAQTGVAVAAVNLAVHRTMVSMQELVRSHGPTLTRTAEEIGARVVHHGVGRSPDRLAALG